MKKEYKWTSYSSSVSLGLEGTKELLFAWFQTLSKARQKRILKEISSKL